MAKAKVKYSNRTISGLGLTLDKGIIESTENSTVLRKAIARVFQRANRRIQNVEKSGVFSPAVAALGDMGDKYSKFSMGGKKTWAELKTEYGKAVAFLQQPTSTASGSREWQEHLRKQLGMESNNFYAIAKSIYEKMNSTKGTEFYERQLGGYGALVNAYEQELNDSAEQIERESVQSVVNTERAIESSLDTIGGITDSENVNDIFTEWGDSWE